MLVLSRLPEQELLIGDDIVVKIFSIRGQQVRIGIQAPKNVRILRGELRKQLEGEKDPTP